MTGRRDDAPSRNALTAELEMLSARVSELQALLDTSAYAGGELELPAWHPGPLPDIDHLFKVASVIQRKRKAVFDPRWIEGPAWTILLHLFDRGTATNETPESDQSIRVETGLTRAVINRFLAVLKSFDLIEAVKGEDGRFRNVSLSDYGRVQMTDVFIEAGIDLAQPRR